MFCKQITEIYNGYSDVEIRMQDSWDGVMLQPYSFTVQHCKGSQNVNADAQSRLPMNNPCFELKKEEGNVTGKLSTSNISVNREQSQNVGASGSNQKEILGRSDWITV